MIATTAAQDQIATFIADAIPDRILAFKFSASVQKRIRVLVNKNKEGNISKEEKKELERYLLYDNLIGLAKARASMQIAGSHQLTS
ncbi:MAG TPA: hypothetical protein ENJ95_14905 [Bacteroidetes bacterium]|nr:hypothetical protein [Bacteroidota bacterium]